MTDNDKSLLETNEIKRVKATISIEGMPSIKNERPEELSQLLGELTPFKIYSNMNSRHSPYKKSVIISTLLGMLNLASNAGREIEMETGLTPSNRTPSIKDIIPSYTTKPWASIKFMYTSLLPSTRRVEDVALLHQPINTAVQAIGLTAELALKFSASFLTYPTSYIYRAIPDEGKLKKVLLAAICTTPFWLVAQTLFAAANVISYSRKIVDSIAQTISTSLSLLSGNYGITQPKFNVPLKSLGKNVLMLATFGIPLLAAAVGSLIIGARNWLTGSSESSKACYSINPNTNTSHGTGTKSIKSSLSSTCTKRSVSSTGKDVSPTHSRQTTVVSAPSSQTSATYPSTPETRPSTPEATTPVSLSDVSSVRFHYAGQKEPEVISYENKKLSR